MLQKDYFQSIPMKGEKLDINKLNGTVLGKTLNNILNYLELDGVFLMISIADPNSIYLLLSEYFESCEVVVEEISKFFIIDLDNTDEISNLFNSEDNLYYVYKIKKDK